MSFFAGSSLPAAFPQGSRTYHRLSACPVEAASDHPARDAAPLFDRADLPAEDDGPVAHRACPRAEVAALPAAALLLVWEEALCARGQSEACHPDAPPPIP